MDRRELFILLAPATIGGVGALEGRSQAEQNDHAAWIAEVLNRMETIRPGRRPVDALAANVRKS